jgi:hypothetical protein
MLPAPVVNVNVQVPQQMAPVINVVPPARKNMKFMRNAAGELTGCETTE